MNAPLTGADYLEDRRTVHTKLKALISEKPESEALIKLKEREADGRTDWKVLKLHYEGDGIYSKDMKQAKKILDNLIYQGERPPTMDWTKFEQQLDSAFAAYVRKEKR